MKVSVPGMPVTLLNMSKNDIYKMVSGDKMDVKMNIFQRLWETLRHLLQLHKGQGNLGVDLRKAYLPGVDMRDCYLGKKTMKGSNDILYERPGWNANLGGATPDGATPDGAILDGATPDGAILDGATVNGATSLYDEVIIINKIPPKKIDTKGVATEEVATKKVLLNKLLTTQLLNEPE